MNEYQEAKKHFELITDNKAYSDKFQDYCKIAVELIDKATPKKAILVHNYDGYVYECPNCHNDFRPNYFANDITWKGCPYCLQALDWTEDTKIL